jgi:hypothetical protein
MIEAVRRTITARPSGRTMSLGDVRKFLGSIESLPDEAPVKAEVGWGKVLRSLTVEDEDVGFRDYIRSVAPDDDIGAIADQLDKATGRDKRPKRDTAARGASD